VRARRLLGAAQQARARWLHAALAHDAEKGDELRRREHERDKDRVAEMNVQEVRPRRIAQPAHCDEVAAHADGQQRHLKERRVHRAKLDRRHDALHPIEGRGGWQCSAPLGPLDQEEVREDEQRRECVREHNLDRDAVSEQRAERPERPRTPLGFLNVVAHGGVCKRRVRAESGRARCAWLVRGERGCGAEARHAPGT